MTCTQTQSLLSPYLDGAVNGTEMLAISRHLGECGRCSAEMAAMQRTQSLLAGLGRKTAPPDLALRLRVAISQEAARSRRPLWEPLLVRLQHVFQAFMVPATAGAVAAVVFFAILIGLFALPSRVEASEDVPIGLYTPPQLVSSPSGIGLGSVEADALLVEAVVDANGRVQDYRIIWAPKDTEKLHPHLKQTLIFTVFRPATAFGRPTSGRVMLSFSKMDVTG